MNVTLFIHRSPAARGRAWGALGTREVTAPPFRICINHVSAAWSEPFSPRASGQVGTVSGPTASLKMLRGVLVHPHSVSQQPLQEQKTRRKSGWKQSWGGKFGVSLHLRRRNRPDEGGGGEHATASWPAGWLLWLFTKHREKPDFLPAESIFLWLNRSHLVHGLAPECLRFGGWRGRQSRDRDRRPVHNLLPILFWLLGNYTSCLDHERIVIKGQGCSSGHKWQRPNRAVYHCGVVLLLEDRSPFGSNLPSFGDGWWHQGGCLQH